MPGPFADDVKCQEFVANLRTMRELRGWRQDQLAMECHFSSSVVSNIEAFQRAPLVEHGIAFDKVFNLKGMFAKAALEARGGAFPREFAKFSDYERTAVSLHVCGHSLLPGLVQDEGYARAVIATRANRTPEETDRMVAARMQRQDILVPGEGRKPPMLWVLIDEGILYRPVAPPEVMYRQLMRLVEISGHPHVRLGVIPYRAGGHSGLRGAFVIARQPGMEGSVVWLEDAIDGRISDKPEEVQEATITFESLQMEALPAGDSRELIAKVAEEQCEGSKSVSAGARALTVATTEESA